uniref:Small G protein signaling modulator 1-like n=1 Tax=Sinocyclocheilus grahami TaxID=75366 RepID=A0A672QLL0_SINGR
DYSAPAVIQQMRVVEACVLHGLKRRAAGFLRSNKLTALFMKVGKMFPPAEELCRKVQELEQIIENKQNQGQMSQESVRKQPRPLSLSPLAIKHLWIRTALTQKLLDKIVLYLVENSSKFYEREALLRDPVDGPILASLLVGPCALEYTKAKTANHFWTDPSADELVQRHRIHSGHCRQDSPTKRPALVRPAVWMTGRLSGRYVSWEALLRRAKSHAVFQTDDMEAIPGYLSLHQTADLMTLKWTPNQLMNGNMGEFDYEKSRMIVNMMLIDFLDAKVVPELMDQTVNLWQPAPRKSSCSSCSQNGSSDGGLPNGCNHDRAPLKLLCETMKHQIISRAFYGWLAYCRQLSTVRTHLSALVNPAIIEPDLPYNARGGLSADVWKTFLQDSTAYEEEALLRLVYYGGVEPSLRKEVWPFLLGHYHFSMSLAERKETSSSSSDKQSHAGSHSQSNSSTQVFGSVDEADPIESEPKPKDEKPQPKIPNGALPNCTSSPDSGHPSSRNFSVTSALSDCSPSTEETSTQDCGPITSLSKQSPDMSDDSPSALEMEEIASSVVYMSSESSVSRTPLILARPVAPALELCMEPGVNTSPEGTDSALSEEEPEMDNLFPKPDSLAVTGDKNDIASPVSSIGTTYSQELVDLYTLNLHRIDKDVQRCDRNFWYFTPANLEKLRNIMCSYVWQHLDIGYVQGMCDLLAPLLVILDDEAMAFSCFTELMKRMNQNFPHGGAMDTHFANMRSLIQILDSELFELMQQNGDYTHFYFCYRWFLLDFKREMVYDDVFSVWETVWAARYASSEHFVLFIALALVELYRDIILENNMDFTDIIKFFNEMAERHDIPKLLLMARELVHKVQILIENK